MPSHFFYGTLHVNYDTAVKADVGRQDFSVCPRHWYIDATFRCKACDSEFVFSAAEQRFWYEERRFYVDSRPRRCPACRKQDRQKKLLKQQYDALFAASVTSNDLSRKQAVLEILDELASTGFQFPKRTIEHRELLLRQIAKQASELRQSQLKIPSREAHAHPGLETERPMTGLKELAERLRYLGTQPPTPEVRAEVIAGLSSKWDGIQSIAVRVLASWGGRECVELLRLLLMECFQRENARAIRGVITAELGRLVDEQDVDWVLDLSFGLHKKRKWEISCLVSSLPPQAARARLVAALGDPRPENRTIAVDAIGNMDYPDWHSLLLPMLSDPDSRVSRSAEALIFCNLHYPNRVKGRAK